MTSIDPSAAKAPSPLARVDAEVRKIEKQVATLQEHIQTTPIDEALVRPLIGGLERAISALRVRRVRIIAGLPEEDDPAEQAPTSHVTSKSLPLPRSVVADPALGREEDGPSPFATAVVTLRSLVGAFSHIEGTQRAVSYTQGQHWALEMALLHLLTYEANALEERRALEARIATLEERTAAAPMKYAGIWQRAIDYDQGSVCTHQGSAWIALKEAPSGAAPGQGDEWQLMVKRGRDAASPLNQGDHA